MVDKGFDIQDLLVPASTRIVLTSTRIILNIPPFLREKDQLSVEEEAEA